MHSTTLLALAATAGVAFGQRSQEPQARSWSQPFGDALGSSFVDVAPLRTAPGESSKLDLGTIVGEPVVWDGVAFVLVKQEGHQLRAYEVATRRLIKHVSITGDAPTAVVAWNWRAGVVTNSALALFDLQRETKTWTSGPKLELARLETPRLFGGVLLCAEPGRVSMTTLERATERLAFDVPRGPSALRPFSAFGPAARATLVATQGRWKLRVVEIDRFDSARPTVLGQSDIELGEGPAQIADGVQLVRLHAAGGAGAWLVANTEGARLVIEGAQPKVVAAPFVGPVAAVGGTAYGFDSSGALVRLESTGSVATLAPASDAPRGWITIARDVAYTAGRAIDLSNGKELWTGRQFGPAQRAIPAADQRLIVVDGKGSLVFLGPKASAKGPAGGALARSRPGDGPGVVKSDGTRIAGTVARSETGWRVENDEGVTLADIRADEVALVESDEGVELVGAQSAVHRAWRSATDPEHRERLLEAFSQFLRQRLVDDCKRLLAEAKACGLDKGKGDELEAQLAKTKPNENSNREGQRKAPLAKENEARKLSRATLLEAAEWCREHDMLLAASSLVLDAERVAPAEGRLDDVVKDMIPLAFPWRTQADAVERWKRWVPHLVTTGARFVAQDEPIWKRLKGSPWDQGVVVLQSRHVLLCSRNDTPEVVGGCLDAAEEAMALLHTIVPPEEGAPRDPLVVRLHADKEEYMRQGAPDFTLGYYSTGDKISRFYVPSGNEAKDVLGRGLYSTVAHELTHHYLDAAWLGPQTERKPQTSSMPGYWIVEGFATFVQDDVIAKLRARSGEPPRDPSCAYVAKGARGHQKLIPFRKLLEINRAQFQTLSKEPMFDLQALGEAGMVLRPAEVNVFYEQSAALVWFLNYKAGPERRAKLAEYVRAQYIGTLGPEGWTAIGYAKPEDLDAAYQKWLQSTD